MARRPSSRRSSSRQELGELPVRPAFIVAGLIALALAFWRRKDIVWAGGKVMDAAKQAIFKAVLPSNARPYADVILRVAQEEGVDPFVIVALGERESRWGLMLRSDGTGDFTPRNPATWKYPMPPDGMGWGRGVMQVDYPRAVAEKHDWRNVYSNVKLGARIYKEKLREVTAPASGSWNITGALAEKLRVPEGTYPARSIPKELSVTAAIAAYNAGAAAIRRAYSAAGVAGIDRVTTGGDYSSWVNTNLTALVQRFVNAGGAA